MANDQHRPIDHAEYPEQREVLVDDMHGGTRIWGVGVEQPRKRLAEIEFLRPHIDWITIEGPAAMLRGEHIRPPFEPAPAL